MPDQPAPISAPPPNTRQRILTMLALVVAGEAIFGLPFVVARVFRPTLLDVFEITNLQLGSAFSVYGVLAMAAYLLGGPLADRYQARTLMALALLSTALGGLVYIQIPSGATLTALFGYWGITTILLFWSPMIRVARNWGGDGGQGRAFGILDGGRGLFAAALGSGTVALFSALLPSDPDAASLEQRAGALQWAIGIFTAGTVLAALLVWLFVPKDAQPSDEGPRNSASEVWGNVMQVARNRAVWLQTLIVLTAYCGYKSLDDYSLYARDAFGYDDVAAAEVGTIALWVRPIAAIAAGVIGDRVGVSRAVLVCFGFGMVSYALMAAGIASLSLPLMLFVIVATTATMVFALRGLYFALFRAAKVDPALTGTAAGLVSVLGYVPDIFMGPLNGILTDRFAGATGHHYFYACVAAFMGAGLVATLLFQRETRA